MPSKNLLMIFNHYPPYGGNMVIRITNLSRELPKYGWGITALAAHKRNYWIYEPEILDNLPKEVNIVRTFSPDPSYFIKNRVFPYPRHIPTKELPFPALYSRMLRWFSYTFFFPDHFISWIPFAYHRAVKLIKRGSFDAIYSSSIPETNHIVAYLLKKRFPQLPWVADFRDFFVDRQFVTNTGPLMDKASRYLERLFVTHADQVWGVTPSLTEEFKERYKKIVPEDRFICLTNGYSREEMEGLSNEPIDIRKTEDEFLVVYTGNLLNTTRVEPFLDVWKEFASKPHKHPVRLVILGDVDLLTHNYIKRLEIEESITIINRSTHEYSLRLQREADMLFHIISPSPRAKAALSTKVSEYLYWRKPTLVIAPDDSDTARTFIKTKVGRVFPLDNPSSCFEYLEKVLENPPNEPIGDLEEVEKFSWEYLGKMADDNIMKLIAPHRKKE